MRKLVLLVDLPKARTALESAAPGFDIVIEGGMTAAAPHLREAEIVASWNASFAPVALESRHLHWIQMWSAGVDRLPLAALEDRNILLTSANGVHGTQIAETIFAMLLAFSRGLHRSIPDKAARLWRTDHALYEIHGQTIGILGVGAIGTEVARVAKALGMRTLGFRRDGGSAPYFDAVYPTTRLGDLLPECDAVVNALPLTPETHHLIDAGRFTQMKSTACYINIGRGATTDQAALIAALAQGQIAFAGLDATDPEPLPPDSPLWAMENVIITPHNSGQSPAYHERALAIFLENLAAYVATGKPVRNLVDYARAY